MGTNSTNDILIATDSPTRTYKKRLFCLNLYIAVTMQIDDPERIDYVKIHCTNRSTDCGHSFYEGLSDILTYAIKRIRNRTEAKLIVKALRGHQCNQIKPNEEGLKSCIDAIGRVIQKDLKITDEELWGRA